MKRKLILVAIVAAVALGAIAIWSRWPRESESNSVVISGNLELTQVDIAFKIAGRIVELPLEEGDNIKKGQRIARIDQEQIRSQQAREQAGVVLAQAQIEQARTALQWQKEAVAREIELRRAELHAAEARLTELMAGPRVQEINQAQAALAEARAQQEQAAKDWERAQQLFANDDISAQQRDQARTRNDTAAAAVRRAEQQVALLNEGTRPEQIEAQKAQVARARAALRMTEANRLETERREQELEARRADAGRARAQLSVAESQLDDTVVTAPIDGVVLVKSAELGETVSPGRAVASIGDIDHPWVRGYISERHLGQVKLGDPVKVTTDSYPNKVYEGRLSFIASEAEFTPKQIQTPEERVKLVYRVKIEVANPNRELKNNMPVEAVIALRPAP
jgi:HlyD family secretion protein